MLAPLGTLTRRRLIYFVRTEVGLPKAKATVAVNAMLEHIAQYLKGGNVVHFHGIGTFAPVLYTSRFKRNPRCGPVLPDGSPNQYFVPAHYRIRFVPVPEIKIAARQIVPLRTRLLTEEQRVQMIVHYLNQVHYASTIAIAGATGLPIPTVGKVLKRHTSLFRLMQRRWSLV